MQPWQDVGGSDRWPTGHLGWVFTGSAEFEGRIGSFLAEGAARHERLMVVADDPSPHLWPRALLDRGALVVASTAEVYGPDRTVDPIAQRITFEDAVAQATSSGFTGIRVAADNTSLTLGVERLAAWVRWEDEADHLMQVLPITGLCAFDRTRVDAETLAAVEDAHRIGA